MSAISWASGCERSVLASAAFTLGRAPGQRTTVTRESGRRLEWNCLHFTAVIAVIRAPGPRGCQGHAAAGHDRHAIASAGAGLGVNDTYFF